MSISCDIVCARNIPLIYARVLVSSFFSITHPYIVLGIFCLHSVFVLFWMLCESTAIPVCKDDLFIYGFEIRSRGV